MALFGIHQGSWGLPELSITEKLSDLFGGQRTAQGGSNLIGPAPVAPPIYTPPPPVYGPPAPNQNIGGGINLANRNTGQNTNPVNTAVPQNNGPELPPPISEEELNSIYNPLMSHLGQQEALANQYRTSSEQTALEQRDLSLNQAASQQQSALDNLTAQQSETDRIQVNAMNQARRAFNEIQQGIQSRYGSSSSAGPAMSEILGRSTQESFSNIWDNYTRGVQQLQSARQQVDRDVLNWKQQIDTNYKGALREVDLTFREQIADINSKRATIESDKAAQRIQALRDYQQQVYNVQTARQAYEQQLELYRVANAQTYNSQEAAMSAGNSPPIESFSQM